MRLSSRDPLPGSFDVSDDFERMQGPSRPRLRQQAELDDAEELGPRSSSLRMPRSFTGSMRIAVILCVVGVLAAVLFWQRQAVIGAFSSLAGLFRSQPTTVTTAPTAPAPRPKIPDRVGQPDQAQSDQTAPVAQKVVLLEEDPADPQGKQYSGTVVWRTETVSPGPGQPPEIAVKASVEIPERRMTMTWSLRRNTDQKLPASHTIEVMFTLPPNFAAGGIADVPGVWMKQAENTRGAPLAGTRIKVVDNFYLIALSAVEFDLQRNLQLLKERSWFDVPIVYTNNRRAILVMEKGTPGERVFAEAMAAWGQ
jgi:hypothetical protein